MSSIVSGITAPSPPAQPACRASYTISRTDPALLDCAHGKGIVAQYTDYLPGSMLWPLRWAMTGIAAIIGALFLLLGAGRLGVAAAKR